MSLVKHGFVQNPVVSRSARACCPIFRHRPNSGRRASSSRRGSGRVRQARPGTRVRCRVRQDRRWQLLGTHDCRRRDEWIDAEVLSKLEQFCLDGYQKMIGLDVENPVDRGNTEPNAASSSTEAASHSVSWSPRRTATIRRYSPLCWRTSPGSASSRLRRSPCTWTPVTTPARP